MGPDIPGVSPASALNERVAMILGMRSGLGAGPRPLQKGVEMARARLSKIPKSYRCDLLHPGASCCTGWISKLGYPYPIDHFFHPFFHPKIV